MLRDHDGEPPAEVAAVLEEQIKELEAEAKAGTSTLTREPKATQQPPAECPASNMSQNTSPEPPAECPMSNVAKDGGVKIEEAKDGEGGGMAF